MKSWIVTRILAYVGKRLDGFKTYIAGGGFILLALAGCAGKLFPDQGLPDMDWETISTHFASGMALFGLGHKLDKIAPSGSAAPGTGTDG